MGGEFKGHAWIRDNVYGVLAIWGMALAYQKRREGDSDHKMAKELENVSTT